MATWRISTPGPLIEQDFPSIKAAKNFVEKYAPMKRGWTGRWVRVSRPGHPYAAVFIRSNSKGRELPGYSIRIRKVSK